MAGRRCVALCAVLACAATTGHAQSPPAPYITTGIFIGAIEEGARIFTPARLLPFEHPEALGHQFPTVLQLHGGEDRLLVLLGEQAGFKLAVTLQRYPTEPDSLWPYAPFQPPPVSAFRDLAPVVRPAAEAPVPGLVAVAYMDRFPVAFIVDTRGLSLTSRHMDRPTSMGLDLSRADFVAGLGVAARAVPARGAAILVYRR